MTYKVAVVGATGNVGREILQILAEREFPASKVYALASKDSVGREVSYGEDDILKVENLEVFDFSKVDIALFSPGSKVSREYAPKAAKAGAIVIDNTSCFRMDENVPLVVPEVNPEALEYHKNIISNPNCSTIQLVMALKPLHNLSPIKRVAVSTYQSVSGAGRKAMDELFNQTKSVFTNQSYEAQEFPKQIAFNAIPQIGGFDDEGMSEEERKIREESKKILGSEVEVMATCVRLPIFIGHAESVHVEFENAIDLEAAEEALREFPGIFVVDSRVEEGYVTPQECAGEDGVFVSRLRKDPSVEHGLCFWVVADNLRKGAALNAVQIAEKVLGVEAPQEKGLEELLAS